MYDTQYDREEILQKSASKVNFRRFSEMEKCLLLKILMSQKAKQNEETENFIYEFQ